MRTLHMHWIRFKGQRSHVCFYSKTCLIHACLIHVSICTFMNKMIKNVWRTLLFHAFPNHEQCIAGRTCTHLRNIWHDRAYDHTYILTLRRALIVRNMFGACSHGATFGASPTLAWAGQGYKQMPWAGIVVSSDSVPAQLWPSLAARSCS